MNEKTSSNLRYAPSSGRPTSSPLPVLIAGVAVLLAGCSSFPNRLGSTVVDEELAPQSTSAEDVRLR